MSPQVTGEALVQQRETLQSLDHLSCNFLRPQSCLHSFLKGPPVQNNVHCDAAQSQDAVRWKSPR